jgi:phosphatidylinositol 3-kinase
MPSLTAELILPHKPSIRICGLLPDKAILFKSAQSPIKIVYKMESDQNGAMIYKVGDNLHQDQIILQIISLMQQQLERNMIYCKILAYSVLATGSDHGLKLLSCIPFI